MSEPSSEEAATTAEVVTKLRKEVKKSAEAIEKIREEHKRAIVALKSEWTLAAKQREARTRDAVATEKNAEIEALKASLDRYQEEAKRKEAAVSQTFNRVKMIYEQKLKTAESESAKKTKKLEAENTELHHSLSSMKADLKKASLESAAQLDQARLEFEKRLDDASKEKAVLEERLRSAEASAKDYEKKVSELSNSRKVIAEQHRQLGDRLKNEEADFKDRIDKMKAEHESALQGLKADSEREKETAVREVSERLDQQRQALLQEKSALEERIRFLQASAGDHEKQLADLSSDRDRAREQQQELEVRRVKEEASNKYHVEKLQVEHDALVQNLQADNDRTKAMAAKDLAEGLEQQQKTLSREKAVLEERLREQIQSVEVSDRDHKKQITELSSELDEALKAQEQLKTRIKERETGLEQRLESMQNEHEKVVQSLKAENERSNAAAEKEFNEKLIQQREELSEEKAVLEERLQKQLQSVEGSTRDYEGRVTEFLNSLEEAREKQQQLEADLEKGKAGFEERTKSLQGEHEATVRSLKAEIERSKENAKALENQRDGLLEEKFSLEKAIHDHLQSVEASTRDYEGQGTELSKALEEARAYQQQRLEADRTRRGGDFEERVKKLQVEHEAAIRGLQEENDQTKELVERLEQQRDELAKQKTSLENRLKDQLQSVEATTMDYEEQVTILSNAREEAREQQHQLEADLKRKETNFKELVSRMKAEHDTVVRNLRVENEQTEDSTAQEPAERLDQQRDEPATESGTGFHPLPQDDSSSSSSSMAEHHREPTIDHAQACIAGLFSCFAAVVLVVLSSRNLYESFHSNKEDQDRLRVVATVLASQAVGCGLLIFPIVRDFVSGDGNGARQISIQMSRIAGAVLGMTSLGLIVVSLTSSNILLLVEATMMFTLSCVSLMALFWPPLIRNDTRAAFNEFIDVEAVPFLSDEATRLEEGGGNYQLLGDEDENAGASNANIPVGEEPGPANSGRIRGTRRLLQLAAPQVLYLYAGCIVLLIRLPFSLSIPHFVSTALSAAARADFAQARHEVLLLAIFGTIDAILDFWCVFLFGYANQRIVKGVRLDLFARIIRQEVAFFDQTSSGELASRLNSDCSEMAGDLTWFFRFSIESVVRITGIAAYMLIRSPLLASCALSIVPIVAAINKLYGDWLQRNAIQVQDALAEANSAAQEALANVRTVVSFAAERRECERYENKIERQYQLNVRQLFMTGIYYMTVSTFLINTVVQATLLLVGSILIQQERLSPEVLLAFMLYQGQLQNETLNLFQSYSSLIKSSGAGDKVFALLDRQPPPPAIQSNEVRTGADSGSNGNEEGRPYEVELKDVGFAYPSRPEHRVLDHFNLRIPQGKTVALVGASGCGKSTIVNLLQRFYDPNEGSVLLNGTDLRELNLEQYRRHMGVVTQNPALFAGTLRENITYGREGTVPEERVVQEARKANADGFIRQFPDGYDTSVGERGVQLSGGQLQRVSIARALLMSPSLLLLDEATSALDAQSETAVQEALDRLLEENESMTTLIVAHRLRTVRNADCIAVIQDGRVAEQGTHEELVAANGIYREMVERAGSTGVLPEN